MGRVTPLQISLEDRSEGFERKRGAGRRKHQSRKRGGYILVLVVLLLCGLMAMAALVIDIGFARLAQRQMQTATDAASLEGLRFRDHLPPGSASIDLEVARRNAASNVVAMIFDDDLLSTSGDPNSTVPNRSIFRKSF